ncbi:MAG TPA: metallophosphoesterase family protein, partial [Actinomycetota bacterium]|nr:metallophosphoesterase family protein [Actinomycetota bacterium]
SHVHAIRGNADRELVEGYDQASKGGGAGEEDDIWGLRAAWTAQQITTDQRDFLAGLPETKTFDVMGIGLVRFCHGSPRSDEEIITAVTSDARLRRILAGVEEELVVCGHTHIQFDRVVDGTRVVNAGSVGMPYEDEPGAYWALFGPEVSLKRTVYDFDEAAERIRNSGFPEADEHARQLFVELLSREETAQFFERLAKEREEAGQEG